MTPPLSCYSLFSDSFVIIILFSSQSNCILSPTKKPSVFSHCPSNLICGIVLSDLFIFPYTVNVLYTHHNVNRSQLDRLRQNKNVETNTIDKLCNILHCDVEDII